MNNTEQARRDRQRLAMIMLLLLVVMALLLWRALDLHVFNKEFLQNQGDARYLREMSVPANRGMIVDRNGEPLAISTPVQSVWANPKELIKEKHQWLRLCAELNIELNEFKRQLLEKRNKEFMYLKRHVIPELAKKVESLKIPGIFLKTEYHRYYPAGEVTAHVVGFTDIDDRGQEGLELKYEQELTGRAGAVRVIRDRLGRTVEALEQVRPPIPGKDLVLTIDKRLQYLAYRELKAAVQKHNAAGGSAVIMDALTGEVYAMVNQPAYNPNNRDELSVQHIRNRAITDVFEPGSTVKPLTVAAALESGEFMANSVIDTSPGALYVGRKRIEDFRNYGAINVSTIIQKSSNVGASKLALAIDPKSLWEVFAGAGFGMGTGVEFPGESNGLLTDYFSWQKIERASLSFGYGVSVTPLQLARAYTIFAGDGALKSARLVRRQSYYYDPASYYVSAPVLKQGTIKQVRKMMELVVDDGGTGKFANVPGYRIAGKTGTVRKSGPGGYVDGSYLAVFLGMAPASNPRLIMSVVVDEPQGKSYYGGEVAAPVFAKVMSGALRMLDIPPDDLDSLQGAQMALLEGGQ